MRRFFCNYCNREISNDEDRHSVILRDREQKKDMTVLHLCSDDIKLVTRLKLIPNHNVKIRRKPRYYNVKVSHLGKEKSLYIIPDWNIQQIIGLDNSDPTKYFLKNGKRFYTKEYVLYSIAGSNGTANLLRYIRLLFGKQTEDEKKAYETRWHNNAGFNKSDAKFMSAMAKVSFDKSDEALSDKQLDEVRRRFKKYAQQVADLLNEEE